MKSRRRSVTGYIFAAFFVCGVSYVYRNWFHVNPTTVALTFLLGVLAVSAIWGLQHAVAVSIAAAAAFNYFFLYPVGTFTIEDPHNWVALGAFLVTAVIASQLSERARREAINANERRRELERLYAFSQQLLSSNNVPEVLNRIPEYVVESFDVKSAAIWLSNRPDVYRSGAGVDGLELQDLQLTCMRNEPKFDSSKDLAFIPLRIGARVIGSFGVSGIIPSSQTLDALGSLISVAIERAATVEKLARAEIARESEQLRSALLDSLTHEFRTPLTAVKASVTSLLGSASIDEAQRKELLTIINEESDRLNRLVGEAAEMAQLDAHSVQLNLHSHAIREAVDEALEQSKQALRHHPVDIKLSDDLPMVRMDLARIKEVLMQLLENAAKYSPFESRIHITGEAKNQMLTTSVADHGPGIDDFEQSLIFEKFYRGRSQRLEIQGTGMGLAIVKAIVEAHGGTVGVTSQTGKGSVFYFSLPVV